MSEENGLEKGRAAYKTTEELRVVFDRRKRILLIAILVFVVLFLPALSLEIHRQSGLRQVRNERMIHQAENFIRVFGCRERKKFFVVMFSSRDAVGEDIIYDCGTVLLSRHTIAKISDDLDNPKWKHIVDGIREQRKR